QVAVLVPTTVLAEQHLRTFSARMAEFPFSIAALSRFSTRRQQSEIIERLAVDVLTMTATPIPRTLHLGLIGVRDISNLETPPEDRLAVETRVTRFNA